MGAVNNKMNESSGSLSHLKYRPDIDGLRAVAVLLVLGFHIFPEWIPGGFIGVDLFFVISGYLISTIIIQNLNSNSFSFSQFYLRRIRRIFPALALVLSCSSIFSLFALYPAELISFKKYLLGGVLFLSNFVSWAESGYFDAAAYNKPLLHLWSLGIEEQFYIGWPLLLVLLFRKTNFTLLIFMLLIASFLLNICTVYGDGVFAFYSPLCRAWELLSGGLLASLQVARGNGLKRVTFFSNLYSIAGLLLLLLGVVLVRSDQAFPGWWAVLPVVAAVLVIASGIGGVFNRLVLARPALVWVGLISYPLYLWHWPLISFAEVICGGLPNIYLRLAILCSSFLLAWGTFELIEKPVRRRNDVVLLRGSIPALLSILVLLGFFGASYYFAPPYLVRPSPTAEATKLQSTGKAVILIGDSHADRLFVGLQREIDGVANDSRAGCIPFYDLDTFSEISRQGKCLLSNNKAYEKIKNSPNIQVVILSSMGPVYLTGEAFKGLGAGRIKGLGLKLISHPEISNRWTMYETAMRDSLQLLISLNKSIIFVIDIPELGLDSRYCEFNYSGGDKESLPMIKRAYLSDCTVSRSDYDARTKAYKELVDKVLVDFPQVTVFDPTELFCDQHNCRGVDSGKILYKDSDHLSVAGSEYVAKYLAPVIREKLN